VRSVLLVFLILFSFLASGQQMRIGVFRAHSMKRIVFAYSDGDYSVFADTKCIGKIGQNEFFDLAYIDSGKIEVRKGAVSLGTFGKVHFIQEKRNTSLSLQGKIPTTKFRKYKDDFSVFANTDLTIINLVDMDNYLAGVVESEGGGKRAIEYYKVQALLSRTYAQKYKSKHKDEGFDLCDRVHCQAYHSMMRYTPTIDDAVKATSGIILVDNREKAIDAYFHANCGGQTCLPEYVWNNAIPYLSTFKDTFCIYTRQATWTKTIPKSTWRNFLVSNYNYPTEDPVFGPQLYDFQQEDRKAFYVSPALGIPLRDLRTNFDLKSTYFSVEESGANVILRGRGFGHGVGMCQEGAMKMAASGYDYQQIALFYFPGAYFYDMNQEFFYSQEVQDLPLELVEDSVYVQY
jgi:stage II sporulation protein D